MHKRNAILDAVTIANVDEHSLSRSYVLNVCYISNGITFNIHEIHVVFAIASRKKTIYNCEVHSTGYFQYGMKLVAKHNKSPTNYGNL